MLVLDSGDAIRGDASVASVVDYTLHGLDNNVLKQLADGQLASSIGDLHLADSVDVVATITLVNTDIATRTVNLYLTPSGGTARRLIPKDFSLGIGYSLLYDGAKATVLNPTGGVVASFVAHASSHTDGIDDIQDATSSVKGVATAAQITKLDAIEAVADVTDAVNLASSIVGTAGKATPVDADSVPLIDSDASFSLKELTWANVKATLKTYFDALYNLYVHPNHTGEVTSVADGTQTIATAVVTLAKMANMATTSLLGRNTAGVGVPEVLSKATALSLLNVADGADVTGSNAPQAHKTSHENSGADEVSIAGLSGLLADDQHVLDSEVLAVALGKTATLFTAETELTIATGVITVTQARHKVDTEAAAASDDLDTINGGTTVNMIILRAEADARTIVIKHGTGNIWLQGKADISLDDLEDGILLFWDSVNSKWFDIGGGGGGTGDVTAAANIDANAVVIGDDGAKGIKKATMLISDNGEMTNPSQPAFQAKPTANQTNIVVGSDVTVVLGTEIFDQGNDFASNIFTAPVTGRYRLSAKIQLYQIDTAAIYYRVRILTSNRIYSHNFTVTGFAADFNYFPLNINVLADMDANDTAYVIVTQMAGTQQTDITIDSFFSGFLAC